MNNWIEQPVFITSIGKTGTTLLVALFDGHEEVSVIPEETDYFDAVHTPVSIILKNPLLNKQKKVEKIVNLWTQSTHLRLLNGVKREKSFATGNLDYSNFDFIKFKQHLTDFLSENTLGFDTVIKAIPYAYARLQKNSQNLKCWVEKTPYHDFNVENKISILESLFPKAKFIHLYREPLDNFIAFEKKDSKKWDIFKFAYDLKRNLAITQKHLDKPNHLLLKYEDIVLNTKETLLGLTQFMGIVYSDGLLNPTKNGTLWQGNSVDNKAFSGISPQSIAKYKKYQDKEKLSILEHLIKKEKSFLGYDLHFDINDEESSQKFEKYINSRKRIDHLRYLKYFGGHMKNHVF